MEMEQSSSVTELERSAKRAATGRPRKYNTKEEKDDAQRKNSLIHYHRKRALKAYVNGPAREEIQDGDVITVHVKITSRILGEYEENVQYRVVSKDNEVYQKLGPPTSQPTD